MTSLVIGASGQVGEHCLAMLGDGAVGTYCRHARPGLIQLDITDEAQLDSVLHQYAPRVLYMMGCEPNVDLCETQPDETYRINVVGLKNTVDAANRHDCKVVYMSSDYIFDGTAGPYDELAPPRPLNVYGWQKLAAEHYVAAFAKEWLIIRTNVVFSRESQEKNFLYRLRRSLLRGETIRVPVDQTNTPTFAPDLVRAIIDLVGLNERGVFNVSGSRLANRYELALAAAEAFGLNGDLIEAVTTAELQQVARRPLTSGLRVEKVERTLGRRMLDYRDGLREMAANIRL